MDERLLLVEDDPSLREMTALSLTRAGFRVTVCGDGREALARFRRDPFDAVVLDVMLPSLDGFEVCREIRHGSSTPVLMLTARSETTDVVAGLELGADDYVTKPFQTAELIARVRAVLRRRSPDPGGAILSVHDLEIDPGAFTVTRGSMTLSLTATEFRLLLELARHRGQVLTRESLLRLVWDYDYMGDSRLVDVAVQRLRSKIEADPAHPTIVQTVRGVGYRLDRA